MSIPEPVRTVARGIGRVAHIVFSGLMEKDPAKVEGCTAPVVLSMSRLVVLALVVVWCVVALERGVGWPMAALGMVLTVGLPAATQIRKLDPQKAVEAFQRIVAAARSGETAGSSDLWSTPKT